MSRVPADRPYDPEGERVHATEEGCWSGLEELRPMLRRFLRRRCRDENEVEDMIQETLIRAARYRRHLAHRDRLRSWALQIAANVFRDHMRRSVRRPTVGGQDEVLDLLPGGEHPPGELLDGDLLELGGNEFDKQFVLRTLAGAMEGLFDRDQLVLSSYYGGGQSTAATATICGIRPELVKVRLFRARRRLERAVLQRLAEHRARRLVGLG